MAKELRDDGSILYTGEGTIATIERKTKLAKVSIDVEGLQYPESGWWEIAKVEPFNTGDRVAYEIVKTQGRDYRDIVTLAPLLGKGGDQAPEAAPTPQPYGRDDAQGEGLGGQPESPAERVPTYGTTGNSTVKVASASVANHDLQRFEGWAFVANVGMVDLAYEELSDALEAGELDAISPELLKTVAGHLLNAADQAQKALVGRTDRGAQSHTRARGCVRTALSKNPVREALNVRGHTAGDLDPWAAEIQKTATRLLALAASL